MAAVRIRRIRLCGRDTKYPQRQLWGYFREKEKNAQNPSGRAADKFTGINPSYLMYIVYLCYDC